MFKSIFIFINLLGVLLLTFFNIEDIIITHEAQSNTDVRYGEQKEVKIIINKMDFSGPGRLKLDLTEAAGLTIIEKDNDGSSFTFKNNEALYIWYDLPNNKNIEITYLINADKETSGMKIITGSFSFINNNDREKLEIPPLVLNVKEYILVEPSVEASRTISGKDGKYIVKIHALKGKHKGFARIKDELPDGYSAKPIETAGGVFKNIDGSAKFIWSELPSSIESFTVSYELTNPALKDTNFSIVGVYASERLIEEGHNKGIPIPITYYNPESEGFTYNELKNDTSQLATIESPVIQDSIIKEIDTIVEEVEIAEKIDSILPKDSVVEIIEKPKNIVTEVKEFIEDTNRIITEEPLTTSVKETIEETTITSNKVTTNINYRVQILAAHRIAEKKYMKKQFNYSDNYDLENHDGWVKYTTGNFEKYKIARDKRNNLNKHNFPGPFVTAYNYGERITVQEALMLSKQSWVP